MSIGLSFQEKRTIDFKDGGHGGHFGLQTESILAIFLYKTPHPGAS